MLVLSRRKSERVEINDNIVVTVISIQGGQVKLGFTAPETTRIVRSELLTQAHATSGQSVRGDAARVGDAPA